MAEAIHCPSCTTRYRLRPERLTPVIRRAQCFSCGGVFPVGDVVQRLLAPPVELPELDTVPETVPDSPVADALVPDIASLSLGDLEGADAEILEKTLVAVPADLPEEKAEATATFPPEITETTLSGYTSARDAIEKLFGEAPAAPSGLRNTPDSHAMDMEATLSALDSTLSQVPAEPGLSEADLDAPSTSTMRLSQEDMAAVIAAIPPPAAAAEPTVALRASDLAAAHEVGQAVSPATRPVQSSVLNPADLPEGGPEQLRLKIGEEIYPGLTMPQLIAWVEEGRILENHLVARQHSENWLEAHKVPGLRPVFERLRRERSGGAPTLETAMGDAAPKKGLFGGLFGKG